ncbi:OmpA family protein [Thermocrinis sp.]|jgi:outer membrane protein OmpA-like peptidoglycan-associated protein|uniref:OmpA family protein n=1 Tax=Thermocrinis sp. TaxID=2024383 RepID=UPI002625269D|nr:OmpA family protein [Thermocrinis sp.]
MKNITILKVLTVAIMFSASAQQMDFRVSEGIAESQRLIEVAYKAGGREKSPYHFEKAKAYRDLSVLFASEMEEISSKIFAMKSMNSASKSIEGSVELDKLSEPELPPNRGKPTIDLKAIYADLQKIREEKAFSCAPKELANAEAYYEGLIHELSKERPKASLVQSLYDSFLSNYLLAKEKVEVAKKQSLVCYTGKVELPVAQAEPKEPVVQRPVEPQEPAKAEEPLMVRARIHFDFNKASIKKEYIPLLKEVAKVLKENPNINLRIEGYTDDIGTKVYNQKLALKRAMAVKNFLVKEGIKPERIQIVGFGKERYIAKNTTPIGRLTNRRAEFIVIQVPTQ